MTAARAVLGLVAFAAVLAACAGPAATGSGPGRWDRDGVRFAVPDGWELLASTEAPFRGSRRLLYLATQPLRNDCTAGAYAQSCRLPIDELEAGGVLLWWHTTDCAGPACSLPDGSLTQVGGRDAVTVPPADGCGAIGQTDASAHLVAVSPQRLDTIVVCAREPTAATLETILAFLGAIDWRTP